MGVYTIGNVSAAALLSRTDNSIKMPFSKMDDIMLTLDGTLTPINAGPGMLPVWMISADRKPGVEIKGSEIPFDGLSTLLGANFKKAATGTPITSEWLEYKTIQPDATVSLQFPISATNVNVSVVGGGQAFTPGATASGTGTFITPVAADTKITFDTTDVGKFVMIHYFYDSTTASQIDYMPTSIPGESKFVSTGTLLDAETGSDIACTFIVPRCQLSGTFSIDEQRMKASATDLKFTILDPGGSNAAVSIIPNVAVLQ